MDYNVFFDRALSQLRDGAATGFLPIWNVLPADFRMPSGIRRMVRARW